MSFVTYEKGLALFRLSGVVSGSFQPVLTCYILFLVIPLFTSDGFIECFNLQLYYYSTLTYILLLSGASIIANWDSFDVLRCRASTITKWDNFFVLQSGVIDVTNWGNFYFKVGEVLQEGAT